jgi:F0F1-type ATP synthase assembly protein I
MTSTRTAFDMDDDQSRGGVDLRDMLGLGGMLVGAIVAGMALGWLADTLLNTSPVFIVVGLAVGIAAGIAGCWMQIRQFLG